MQADIIIPHFNDVVRLRRCLERLAPQVADRPVAITVVDNGSHEDIAPLRRDFPQVAFHVEPAPGAAAARNRGVAETGAPWLFFTDADCVPAEDWVDTALAMDGAERIVGGAVDVFDETPPPRSGAEAFETVFAFPQETYVRRKHFSVTANMLVTRAMFETVGPFDGSRAEDSDWCLRARACGYGIVYAPSLKVAHPTRSDWPALRRKWRRITSESYFLHGTAPLKRLTWGLRSTLLLGSVPVHALRTLRHPALRAGERGRALAVLVRLRVLRTVWTLRQALFGEAPINQPAPVAARNTGPATAQR